MSSSSPKTRITTPLGTYLRWLLLVLILGAGSYGLFRWRKDAPPPARRIKTTETPVTGQIALIIDDNGYSQESCRQLRSIPQPLTVSILPDLPYSRSVDDCAHRHHKGIMLHLPMEPHVWHETYGANYVVTSDMTPSAIRALIDSALQSVPHAQGVNNHMGSKATEDKKIMQIVLHELQERDLFFIDSRVTLQSVAPGLAREMGIPCAERDVFLDNEADRDYIIGQMNDLAREAREKGVAIGIGHARPLTWSVIREQAPLLVQEGFRFVTVKELWEHPSLP